ncbi:KSR2 Kinase, partial [Aegithalos caudatus]|nr:KSR2 Kinase [Aegithalos caudatus]
CPPLESGPRSLPPSPRQRHAAHTPPRTPNIVTTVTPPGTPPVRRRNKLKPPGTPPPSSRKLIHLIPGFTALHRSKSHEFQLGHRVDEAHTPKKRIPWHHHIPSPSLSTPLVALLGKPFSCRGMGWQRGLVAALGTSPPLPEGPSPCPQGHPCIPKEQPLPSPALLSFQPPIHALPSAGEGADGSLILLLCNLDNNDVSPCSNSHPPGGLIIGCSARAGLERAVPSPTPLRAPGMLPAGKTFKKPPRAIREPDPGGVPGGTEAPEPLGRSGEMLPTVFSACRETSRSGRGRFALQTTSTHPPPASFSFQIPHRTGSWIFVVFFPSYLIIPGTLFPPQNEEGAEEVQESEDDFEEMNLSLLSARNFPRKASQTSIFLQEWDIPFEQLEIGELIGKGRFGQVFHGRWHGEVAIRLIDIERDNEDQLKAFKREVMAYRQTRHENVVLFMGACMSPPHLAIITSLCKGRTLYSVVRDAKIVLDVNKTRQIAQEIVKGMGYLHAKGILHKDLKSKNVFYDNGKVVITDFGLFSISGVLQAGRRENKLRIQNGWLCHLAPEIIRQLSPDTEEDKLPFSKHSDVFALGTIWYELHAREWPFKTQPAEAIIWQVGRGMKPNLSQIGMGKEISDILLFCWAYEQEERPTFTKLMDMLEKLPKRNRRLSHPGHFWKSAE